MTYGPITTEIEPEKLIDFVSDSVEGNVTPQQVELAFKRLNENLLPEQRRFAEDKGGIYHPAILHVQPSRLNNQILHVGQRFRLHSRIKKYGGDFEVCRLRVNTGEDDPRSRGMEDHFVVCRRILKTKVSGAESNEIVVPFSAFEASNPWHHYNRAAWHVLSAFPIIGETVPYCKAPDCNYIPDDPSNPTEETEIQVQRWRDSEIWGGVTVKTEPV